LGPDEGMRSAEFLLVKLFSHCIAFLMCYLGAKLMRWHDYDLQNTGATNTNGNSKTTVTVTWTAPATAGTGSVRFVYVGSLFFLSNFDCFIYSHVLQPRVIYRSIWCFKKKRNETTLVLYRDAPEKYGYGI